MNQLKVHCNNGMENQNVYGCVCDISTSEGRLILKKYVEKELDGQLDCLINNVGTNKRAPIEESTEEEYEIMIKTNLDSCFFLCKIFSSHLLKTNDVLLIQVFCIAVVVQDPYMQRRKVLRSNYRIGM